MVTLDLKEKNHLLGIGPQPVWPANDGGKEGIYGALRSLSDHFNVTYVCPAEELTDDAVEHFASLGIDYRPINFHPHEKWWLIVSSIARLKPYKFQKYCTNKARRQFSQKLERYEPDAIISFHAHTADLALQLRKHHRWTCPIIMREHNIEYELVRCYRARLPWIMRVALFPLEWLTRREEQNLWQLVERVAFLTDHDYEVAMRFKTKLAAVLAPEGISINPKRTIDVDVPRNKLLILYNPRATQNTINLRKFLNEYWSQVYDHQELADISIQITGVTPDQLELIGGLSTDDQARQRIHAIGFQENLMPLFESALALVSPTFVGAGIRKKVLESMANQLPVIASDLDIVSCSFFEPHTNILPLGTPSDFIATVKMLHSSTSLWRHLSENGRATVERHASWDVFARVIADEIFELADRQRQRT